MKKKRAQSPKQKPESAPSFLRERPEGDEIVGLYMELQSDNDRSAAIVAASLLDYALGNLLRAHLRYLRKGEVHDLFGNGPLGSFSSRKTWRSL
jgi:hypothetical protein